MSLIITSYSSKEEKMNKKGVYPAHFNHLNDISVETPIKSE